MHYIQFKNTLYYLCMHNHSQDCLVLGDYVILSYSSRYITCTLGPMIYEILLTY